MFKFLSLLIMGAFAPKSARASGGLSEFSGPLDKILATFTGPVGMTISTIAFVGVGLGLFFGRKELDDSLKLLLNIALIICFVAFAGSIIGSMFSFSGATI